MVKIQEWCKVRNTMHEVDWLVEIRTVIDTLYLHNEKKSDS